MLEFFDGWRMLQAKCAETNTQVWPATIDLSQMNEIDRKSRKLLQIVGEVIEAQDALRIGNPQSDKIIGFTSEEEELADVVLRVMDYAEKFDLDIAEAIIAKAEYNKTRPIRHGGKLF